MVIPSDLVPHAAPVTVQLDKYPKPITWKVSELHDLSVADSLIMLSPDGRWVADTDPQCTLCVWKVATEEARCADYVARLPPGLHFLSGDGV